ncbi:MAG: carbamoyltransferase HypF [Desulfurococcaceae archaeon]
MRVARRLIVVGLVQGVGFRPFVHRLALRTGVAGYVRNVGGSEVEIWIEGEPGQVEDFVRGLVEERPPPCFIEDLTVEEVEPRGFQDFAILPSLDKAIARSNVPPDLAICGECLREVLDPGNRRYRYPFNSCAWCGPRFSMMYRVPYDRANTSMAKYELCEECRREYGDPGNLRRYHAQGISCPRDGPRLQLLDSSWSPVEAGDPIEEAAKLIEEGNVVAIKGIGGYHLACLATDDDVVLKLRERKRRPRKPFAIMGLDVGVLERLVYVSEEAREILESPQAPIVLLPKREDSPVSKYVSPGMTREGVFRAYTALHYLLLMGTRDKFLVMTSGNVSGEPMCSDEDCARRELSQVADYFLVHDREIVNRVDDSVVRFTGGRPVLLRRSRGYAPLWIRVGRDLGGEFVALGADLNNAAAVGFEDKIVLTQYVGDLDEEGGLRDLHRFLEFFARSYRIDLARAVVAVDKHPRYVSRALGEELARSHGSRLVEVQHHYAHVLGAAYDVGARGRVVGIAVDGLGWGDDGTVWGGEVLAFDASRPGYRRAGALRPLPLTSDADALRPLRIATALLASLGWDLEEVARLRAYRALPERALREHAVVHALASSGRYVRASSTGRLLDAASALLGACSVRTYEGEPAMALEELARGGRVLDEAPEARIAGGNGLLVLDYGELFEWLALSLEDGARPEDLAATFLARVGEGLGELAARAARGWADAAVISGGAAVNDFIYSGASRALAEIGLELRLPRRIPPNDGGIAFGQVVAASLALEDGS